MQCIVYNATLVKSRIRKDKKVESCYDQAISVCTMILLVIFDAEVHLNN
jgi:hypothetical protein